VDVLVNNAGISSILPAENTSASQFRRVLDVNLVAPFVLSRVFGSIMLAQRTGSIINIASIAGLMGIADRVAYNASKHGLIGLTRTLAAEWGGRGVRCNAVSPGWVKTPTDTADQASIIWRLLRHLAKTKRISPQLITRLMNKIFRAKNRERQRLYR
jgi:NAD(P)-dependent dehydrogenase (short-subunit alcohol dehydrogenase family)